jgi:hypothetical protein
MRIKKAYSKKKGGANTNVEGPLLPEILYNANYTGKLESIKSIYDDVLKKKGDELDKISKSLDYLQKAKNDEDNKNLRLKEIQNKKKIADDILFEKKKEQTYKMFTDFLMAIKTLLIGVYTTGKDTGSLVKNTVSLAFNSGEGILFKVIILIFVVIVVIVFIILGFTGVLPSGDISNSNDISKSILTNTNEYNFMNFESGSLMSKFSKKLYDVVPNEYRYKLNNLSNSMSYITTGKNQYDDYLEDRKEIKTGRNDNIFHIIQENIDNTKTVCLLKPTDINIEFVDNSNTNIDYYNINEKLRKDINYPSVISIPFKVHEQTNKYVLDVKNQLYSNLSTGVTNRIDKTNNIFIQKNNNIQLNSFNNLNYTKDKNIYIAMYAPILINSDYKGPIMKIKRHSKYYNLYYNTITNLYYYKDEYNNSSSIYATNDEFILGDSYGEVYVLYDQTGNNYNYYYDPNFGDARSPPNLYINGVNSSIIFMRHILKLEKPYPNKKINIKTKIKVNTDPYYENLLNRIDTYMDFLSTNTSSIIKIQFTGNVINNLNYDIYNEDVKNNTTYLTNKQEIINIDMNNASNIICLGHVDDSRSDIDKKLGIGILGLTDSRDGTNLLENKRKHAFIGCLYNLIITKI